MNKKTFLLLIMIFNTLIFSNTIYASEENIQSSIEHLKITNESIEPNSYDTVRWYYRIIDGRKQRRLWSLTAGEWLNDWEWV